MLMRILIAAVMAVVGLIFGLFGTMVHTSTIGGMQLPWGIVVALAALACLLVGTRLLSDGRLFAACAALGALVAIAVLSQRSSGGSVLITNSVIGWVWMGGAVIIALLAVGWPRGGRVHAA